MSSEEIDTDNSENSRSDVSSLDAGFMKTQVELSNSEEEFSDNELDSQVWNEIDSESDGEFQEDYGIVDEVNPTSQDNTIYPIDCYRHFITHEEMLKFVGIIIEMALFQIPKVDYYWSKSKLYGSEVIQNTMSRDKFELILEFLSFFEQ
ncbi:unnamed protein product [Adineta ricciae]|uniref:PiggyBac transposable element-derived protein domain-containing protein n=1 Tax=Adineta ricciae TaxID=249248 RepID=A0A815J545_ADIRI|nr:unnamed protein product [Adineta ricciae]CAF1495659.1 unnamed protein product [Adineta ricciae]